MCVCVWGGGCDMFLSVSVGEDGICCGGVQGGHEILAIYSLVIINDLFHLSEC